MPACIWTVYIVLYYSLFFIIYTWTVHVYNLEWDAYRVKTLKNQSKYDGFINALIINWWRLYACQHEYVHVYIKRKYNLSDSDLYITAITDQHEHIYFMSIRDRPF